MSVLTRCLFASSYTQSAVILEALTSEISVFEASERISEMAFRGFNNGDERYYSQLVSAVILHVNILILMDYSLYCIVTINHPIIIAGEVGRGA
jgi:hypothetical protein